MPKAVGIGADPELLRTAHIRALEQNAALEKKVAALEKEAANASRQSTRMTPEELDAVYVEERRLIDSLQREVGELKVAQNGVRQQAKNDVAAARSETQRVSKQCEQLREESRRLAQLTAAQLEQVRSAYKGELDAKASECESSRMRAQELEIQAGLERSRADSLARKLAAAEERLQELLEAPPAVPSAADGDVATAELRAQLQAALQRTDAAERAIAAAGERATASEAASDAARAAEAEARAATTAASAESVRSASAAAEERKLRREAEAAAKAVKADLESARAAGKAREEALQLEVRRLSALLEEARTATERTPPPAVAADDGRSVFTDFVGLKREIGALQDENAKLRRGVEYGNGLPPAGGAPRGSAPAGGSHPVAPPIGGAPTEPPETMTAILQRHAPTAAAAAGLTTGLGASAVPPVGSSLGRGGGLLGAPSGRRSKLASQPLLAGSLAVGRRSSASSGSRVASRG